MLQGANPNDRNQNDHDIACDARDGRPDRSLHLGGRDDGDSRSPLCRPWVTEDGHIRHELLPNGRYVEARGNRERAYEGRYEVSGNHIDYWDDTGITAAGEFRNGVLYHAGMVLYRR